MCQHVPTCANMCQWDQMSTCNLANSQHGLGPIQRLFSVKHYKNALQLAWPKSKGAETAKSSTRNTIIESAPTSTENASTKSVKFGNLIWGPRGKGRNGTKWDESQLGRELCMTQWCWRCGCCRMCCRQCPHEGLSHGQTACEPASQGGRRGV